MNTAKPPTRPLPPVRELMHPRLLIQRLDPAVPLPAYQSDLAAGMDIHAALTDPVVLAPGDIRLIPAGFRMALPAGFEAQIRPRSGLASKFGVTLPNAPGTIDADYRGQVMIPLINLGRAPFTVEPHMRIAQMVIAPVLRAQITERPADAVLPPTTRDTGGFGSTGL